MGLSLPKSNLIFFKKCLDKWVHFTKSRKQVALSNGETIQISEERQKTFSMQYSQLLEADLNV